MSRTGILLSLLAALLVVVLSFFFLVKPKMDEVTDLEQEAVQLRDQQQTLRSQIATLRNVRDGAPGLEARLAAADAVIPQSLALPAAVRQIQTAADDSGAVLVTIAPGRPSAAEIQGAPQVAQISLTMDLEGGYFQIVDFLRRLEDPAVTPRGILVSSVAMTPSEYPTLSVNISGIMFARLDEPPPLPGGTQPDTTGEADVDVDVDAEDGTDVDVDVDADAGAEVEG